MSENVTKVGITMPVSEALQAVRQMQADWAATIERARNTTPEQMAAERRARRAERAAVRATTPEVPFSADVVEERLGLSPGMLLHMSQPYCRCSTGHDGIEYCAHAGDLGLMS